MQPTLTQVPPRPAQKKKKKLKNASVQFVVTMSWSVVCLLTLIESWGSTLEIIRISESLGQEGKKAKIARDNKRNTFRYKASFLNIQKKLPQVVPMGDGFTKSNTATFLPRLAASCRKAI